MGVGPGHTSQRDGDVRTEDPSGAGGHLPRAFLADDSRPLDGGLRNAEDVPLGLRGVTDGRALEICRSPRGSGEAEGQASPGQGFCAAHRLGPGLEQPSYDLLQLLVIRGEDVSAQAGRDLLGHRADELFRLGPGGRLGRDPHLDLTRRGEVRHGRIGGRPEQVVQHLGDLRLGDARGPDRPGYEGRRAGQPGQLRQDGAAHHLPHLRRNARDGVDAPPVVRLVHETGSRSPVRQDVSRAFWHVGLSQIDLRHVAAQPPELVAEEVLDLPVPDE